MELSVRQKFKRMDVVFQLPSIKGYFIELSTGNSYLKEYDVKCFKDNQKEILELSNELSSIISEDILNGMNDPDFKQLENRLRGLNDELEIVGKIKCYLENDNIKVEVFYKSVKENEFNFTRSDYLDPLIEYLSNEFKTLITK